MCYTKWNVQQASSVRIRHLHPIFASDNCTTIWSTAGRTCLSPLTLALSLMRPTQIHKVPLNLDTTAMLAHHQWAAQLS